uniref:Uncharacterized protein n=1 Tax=viral metagenome TaxID=1070528 RepID=A0A6C0BTP9_9ZZZZ
MYNYLVSYIFSFTFVTVTIAYILKIPYLLTNNKQLVNEYYGKNFSKSALLDLFLFAIYLGISQLLINYFNVNTILYKLITVAITTIFISGSFALYFLSKPVDKSFFSRWFHAVQYKAVVYDIILLTFSYFIYNYLLTISINKTLI